MKYLVLLTLFLFPPLALAQNNTSVTSGPEEIMMGPTNDYIDSQFLTTSTPSGIRAFSANSSTYSFSGSNLDSLHIEGKVLDKGEQGKFDECGAWLQSTYKIDENHWLGWYHSEEKCNYTLGKTHKSVAFAESFDAGRTWVKTNYPNNQVLSSDIPFNDTDQDDVGDMHVIPQNEYLYMFFVANWQIHVARSLITDQGRPGTWNKYHNGSFNQPGIGGSSSAIPNLSSGGSYVTYNRFLNSYISIAAYGRWGFYFRQSNGQNLLDWQENLNPIVTQVSHNEDLRVDNWITDRSQALHVYGYPSIVDLNGNPDSTGRSFWLYYMKLYPKEDFTQRYLVRRKITINSSSDHKVALSSPVSIDAPKPDSGQNPGGSLGYLTPYSKPGLIPVFNCQDSSGEDFLTVSNPATLNWEHCQDQTDTFVRKIGYISLTSTGVFKKPLTNPLNNQIVGYIIPPTIDGDINEDLKINIFDYNILVSEFGKTGDLISDIDANQKVDIFDYNILVGNFGKSI